MEFVVKSEYGDIQIKQEREEFFSVDMVSTLKPANLSEVDPLDLSSELKLSKNVETEPELKPSKNIKTEPEDQVLDERAIYVLGENGSARFEEDPLSLVKEKGSSESPIRLRKKIKKKIKQYPCEFCGKMYALKTMFELHRRKHYVGRFPCKFCGKIFSQRSMLKYHIHTDELCFDEL